ncbi:hypothetical protein [Flexithrix dorotheae]|uniref:hypothetical protein n=1 Tax=Flexithrix dorotheae TaxID=70993 RepID=UPI0003A38285|nr:hypothetical protein [Flexithrix dorotheae]
MRTFYRLIFILLILFPVSRVFSQESDTLKKYHFNGNVSITNNGFSFIPTFSLGKPATIATLSIGDEKFSFDPQFRFDLNGLKPWSFIFIWRYNLVKNDRWLIRPGVHLPAIAFRTREIERNGEILEELYAQRFLTPELTISYQLTKKFAVGTYYIYGIGLEKTGQARNTHFISLRFGIQNIRLAENLNLHWNPEVYYMNIDGKEGVYFAQALTLSHKKFPISISSIANKGIKTEINSGELDWNISLVYSFKNSFTKK